MNFLFYSRRRVYCSTNVSRMLHFESRKRLLPFISFKNLKLFHLGDRVAIITYKLKAHNTFLNNPVMSENLCIAFTKNKKKEMPCAKITKKKEGHDKRVSLSFIPFGSKSIKLSRVDSRSNFQRTCISKAC